jgi:hypothetical protein
MAKWEGLSLASLIIASTFERQGLAIFMDMQDCQSDSVDSQ